MSIILYIYEIDTHTVHKNRASEGYATANDDACGCVLQQRFFPSGESGG